MSVWRRTRKRVLEKWGGAVFQVGAVRMSTFANFTATELFTAKTTTCLSDLLDLCDLIGQWNE